MKKRIVIVDGMSGLVGAQIVERLRASFSDKVEIIALGTNSNATERMLKAGADKGASGENAIRVSVGSGVLVMGPIGIVIPNSMLGEITPAIAEAVLSASAARILVPVSHEHFILAGLEPKPLNKFLDDAVAIAREKIGEL